MNQKMWRLSGVRPLTLLIASGIVLISAILIVTGLTAGHMREQALDLTEHELARLDSMLSEAAGHSMRVAGVAAGSLPSQAALPTAELIALFRAAALGEGATVCLAREDGVVLAQFPAAPPDASAELSNAAVRAAVQHRATATLREAADRGEDWQIAAVRPLADYPLSVVISRRGADALANWAQQAVLFGAFAVVGAAAIGLMIFLIARQFRFHDALAAERAERIEADHARLLAEAELLKKERLSVLGQLTATVAHELRNPLSAIRNTLFTVKELAAQSAAKLDRPIARMERSIERCDRIITDLLEYTRTRELRRNTVTFDAWLHDLLAEHPLPPGVALARECGAGAAVATLDIERIRRVLINLIDNAAQALTEQAGNSDKRITVRSACTGDAIEFAVADNGPGVAPENRARIFEPLFSTKSFGTGLGLATVKQIVGEHGGIIEMDSEVGVGTTFTVRLPLKPQAKAAA